MKIKRLFESAALVEDNEKDLTEIDLTSDSVKDVADAVEDTIDDISNGEIEISSEHAMEVAKETKEVAASTNAGQVAIVITDADYEDGKVESRLSKVLDKAYASALRFAGEGAKNGANVLVEGLPGSGKTAVVEN